MSTALVSQNGLGLKNTFTIGADVKRHALLYASLLVCGTLNLVVTISTKLVHLL